MKKSFLILLFATLSLVSCGKTAPSSNTDYDPTQGTDPAPDPDPIPDPKPDPDPDPAPDPIPRGEFTKTIKLSGTEFSSFATDTGKQIDNEEHSAEKEQLLTYLRSKVDYETMVSELDCTKINTAQWETGVALCVGTGYYLNDKFSKGTFKWSSDAKIYHVEVKARAYTKYNDYAGTLQIDEPAKIQLDNGEKLSLFEEGDTTPEIKSIQADYPDGADCFTIRSYDARVVLEEVTITWKA